MDKRKLQSLMIRKIKLVGLWTFIICFFFGTSFLVQGIMNEREVRSKENQLKQDINIRKTSENQIKILRQNSKQRDMVSKYAIRKSSQQGIGIGDDIKKDEVALILEWKELWIYWFLTSLFHNA